MQFRQIVLSSIFWRGLYFFTVVLLNVLLAQLFGSANTGWIYYLTNFFSLVLLLGSLNFESGMGFFASKRNIAENKLAFFSLVWTIAALVIISVLLYFFYELPVYPLSRQRLLFMAITYIGGLMLTNFFAALFYAQAKYFLPNAIMSVCNMSVIVVGLSLYFFFGKGQYKEEFLTAYFIAFLLQGVLLAVFYGARNKLHPVFILPGKNELALLFRYSMLALAGNFIYFLLYRIDYWFIQNTCLAYPPGELTTYLGNYIQVSKIGQLFLVLPTIIASAVFPSTAAGHKNEVNLKLPALIKGLLIIYIGIVILLAAAGKWFFPWLYGATFNHMYLPFLLLMPGIVSLAIISLLSAYNSGNNRMRINITGAVIGLVVIVIGDWLFIPAYGINAAALVSTVGYMSYLAFMLYVFRKEQNLSLRSMIVPGKKDWNALVNVISGSWK